MPLQNSSEQFSQRVEDFYAEMLKEEDTISTFVTGNAMLEFITMLNDTFKETIVWGFASHYRLVLQAENDWKADWLIVVNALSSSEYYIEYRLPPEKSPWEYATVKGVAPSLAEARRYLIIAMRESGGWASSQELKQLSRML